MSLLLAFALTVATEATDGEATELLERCQVTASDITWDEEFEVSNITLANQELNDDQLACIADGLQPTRYFIRVPDKYLPRYRQIVEGLVASRLQDEAREWFAERGMLDEAEAIPFESLSPDETIVAIEEFCGSDSYGVLTTAYGSLTLAPEWTAGQTPLNDQSIETFACVTRSLILGDIQFGFIGNERLPEEE